MRQQLKRIKGFFSGKTKTRTLPLAPNSDDLRRKSKRLKEKTGPAPACDDFAGNYQAKFNKLGFVAMIRQTGCQGQVAAVTREGQVPGDSTIKFQVTMSGNTIKCVMRDGKEWSGVRSRGGDISWICSNGNTGTYTNLPQQATQARSKRNSESMHKGFVAGGGECPALKRYRLVRSPPINI